MRRTRKTRAQLCLSVGQQSEASAKAVSFSSFSPHPQHKKLLGFSTADCGPYQRFSTPAAIFLRSARFLTDLLVEIVGRMAASIRQCRLQTRLHTGQQGRVRLSAAISSCTVFSASGQFVNSVGCAESGQCRRGLDLGLVTSTRGNRGEILVNTVPPGGVFFEEASSRCHSDI